MAVLTGRGVATFDTSSVDEAVAACAGATRVAVDAPSDPATGRVHGGVRSAKFAVARCNEIAAGEELGIWVPWVTPTADACPTWMRTGFALWRALREEGQAPMEVYPAGCFWLLNGRRWPPRKSTADGRAARARLLEPFVDLPDRPLGHDDLDAVMAAVVARGPSRAIGHTAPGCDASRLFVLSTP